MFLRRIGRRKDGKRHFYWALVESYRTERGVRQRVVSYIGDEVLKWRGQKSRQTVEPVESYQQDFLAPEQLPRRATIEPRKTRTERRREFGGAWLGNKLFDMMGLGEFFSQELPARSGVVDWATVIRILVLSRFFDPSSELHIAEQVYEASALEDLLGVAPEKLYDNRLYRGLDRLLPHKKALERHLKERVGSLFEVRYDLFLYDVTSTYFEGAMEGSRLAARGHSRDSRPDCKQVCIALVVTREGLPLGYEVFAGNTNDSRTVEQIVTAMEEHYGAAERIWVMDRGMVSEQNIAFLRQSGRRYIIGTPRQSLRRFEQHLVEQDWREVHKGVDVKLCASPDGTDEVFILCRSADRARKEQGIHDRFATRLEAGLQKLLAAAAAHPGKDISALLERRLGRLLQAHSRAASLFDVKIRFDEQAKQTLVDIDKKDDRAHWLRRTEGYYLLRSNVTDWKPEELWGAYIHLTDAEEAFHIHKSDLSIRPIWHHKDQRIQAHILVCFLAFVLWKAFGLMCKNAGLGDEPRRVFEEVRTIAMVDVVLTTTEGIELKIRTVTKPDKPLQILLHKLGLRLPERLTKRVL